jgi:hypothetical protein
VFVRLKTGRRAGEVVEMKYEDARALIQAEQAEDAYSELPQAPQPTLPRAQMPVPAWRRPKKVR